MTLDLWAAETSRKDVVKMECRPKLGHRRPKLVSINQNQNQNQNQSYLQHQHNIDRLMTKAWGLKKNLHRQPSQSELEAHFTPSQLAIIEPYLLWAFPSLSGG